MPKKKHFKCLYFGVLDAQITGEVFFGRTEGDYLGGWRSDGRTGAKSGEVFYWLDGWADGGQKEK